MSDNLESQLLILARNATEASQVLQRLNGLLAPYNHHITYDRRIDKSWHLLGGGEAQHFYTLADVMEAAIEVIANARIGGAE